MRVPFCLHSLSRSFLTSMTFPLGWSLLFQNPLFNSQADPVFICAKRQILVWNWTLSQSPVHTPYHSRVRGGWMLTLIPLSQAFPRVSVAACSTGGLNTGRHSQHIQIHYLHPNRQAEVTARGTGSKAAEREKQETRSQGSNMQHWDMHDCSMKH